MTMGDKTLAKMLREEGAHCSSPESEIVRRLDVLWGEREGARMQAIREDDDAMAAALHTVTEKCKRLEAEIDTITADNAALRAKNEALEARVNEDHRHRQLWRLYL